MIEPGLVVFNGWNFRWQVQEPPGPRLLVALHGWMGDENSIWVLARNLGSKYNILAPRAPFTAPEGGYTWREIKLGTWGEAGLEDFRPAARSLINFLDGWAAKVGLDARQFDLLGFSQGAAMTYTMVALFPGRIRRFAALSGFLPEEAGNLINSEGFLGKPAFITHGTQDDMVPVERARLAASILRAAGANVSYCESDTKHKASKECLREMEAFFCKD